MENYVKGAVLGTGTFGEVYKATHKQTGEVVAVKKIRVVDAKEGINVTALREIKILRELKGCPNIVNLLDAWTLKKNILLVFDFMVGDLEAIIKDKAIVLSASDIKSYMQMIMKGLADCHRCWVIHRDMKPNNCLISPTGELKLGDFGLSRLLGSPERGRPYTNQVFARWYRSPELLYGSTMYGFAPDVWAAGCIFAELLLRRPWFPGESDIDQLGKVFQALGTPSEESWPGVTSLPNYLEFQKVLAPPLKNLFPKASEDALDLLSKMVALDPKKRLMAHQVLAHRFFSTFPLPTPPSKLPKPVSREAEPLQNAPLPSIQISRPAGYQQKEESAISLGKLSTTSTRSPQPAAAASPGVRPSKRHQAEMGHNSPRL
ncbi:hypothetical protein CEUSTIGMA_g4118.t1 [Chlamydomonas eustigma]|uniref:[RNA-polymerase]-subunit kinase n=1 Tax=Chlamydomonas eustigma TaxID=1157962 RepID=A0A250X1B2_9CHLO|nr:hypothetical protein CEUSTIGMA_g4118.t1 [Chlamydomonas eustigma]|eukprot:GAX76672.1 hypothetical protein CEUSTIGMA_g4118.t1 [Chlamydomonas eustigma]